MGRYTKGVGYMNIIELEINEIIPYKDNPRVNKDAVNVVKNSLSKFGWQQPLVLDKNKEIVVGHTRYYAAHELGMKKIPCLIAEDLSEEKIKAYRIMDNKSSEYASWNYGLLTKEMQDILDSGGLDLTFTGFSDREIENMIEDIQVDIQDEKDVARMDELNLITCPSCGHKFSEFSAK